MTNEEAKQAFFDGVPVMCNGIFYLKISAIIYRLDREGKLIVSAELQDKNRKSITIARVQDLGAIK